MGILFLSFYIQRFRPDVLTLAGHFHLLLDQLKDECHFYKHFIYSLQNGLDFWTVILIITSEQILLK